MDPRFNGEKRTSGSSIYYLLQSGDFSAFHRLKSDETWYYHAGSALTIYVLQADKGLSTAVLGNMCIDEEAHFQVTVTAGSWFAASVNEADSFSLVGCSVSPGFSLKILNLPIEAS